MKTVDLVQHLLPLVRAKSPPCPPVARIEVEERLDSTDYPSLFFWVLFPDSVTEEEQTLEAVQPLEWTIKEEVWRLGETRWPYVRFRTESEYERRYEDWD